MIYDSWFYIAFGAGLFYLFLHPDKVRDTSALYWAWLAYVGALVPNVLIIWFRAQEQPSAGAAWACVIASALLGARALRLKPV